MTTSDTKHTRPPGTAEDEGPSCPTTDVESGDRLTYFQPSPLPSLPPPTATAVATASATAPLPLPTRVYGHRPLPVPGAHPETPSDIHWPKTKPPSTRASSSSSAGADTELRATTKKRVSPVYVPTPLLRGVFYDEETYGRDASEHSSTQETSAPDRRQAVAWTPKFAHYTELPDYAPPSLPPKQESSTPSVAGEEVSPEGYPAGMRSNTMVVPRPWRHLAWILRNRPRVSCVDALGVLMSCLLLLLTLGRYRRRLWYAERGYWIYPRAGRVAFSFVVPAAMIDANDKGSHTSCIPLCPGLLETAIHYHAEDAGRFVERFAPTFERKISSWTLCCRRRRRRLRRPLSAADDGSDEGRAPQDAEPYSCEEEWLEDALGAPLPRLKLYKLSDSVKRKQD